MFSFMSVINNVPVYLRKAELFQLRGNILEDIIYNNLITMAGIVFAAIVGGFFSFVSLISSKEQKVSEFRQAWIDELRGDLSVFLASARSLCRAMEEARSTNADDVKDFRFEPEQIGNMRLASADALYRVKLRLNKNEPEHKKLLKLLETAVKIQNQINIDKGPDYSKALNSIESASEYSQDILKNEWERVKNGEPSYRRSKNFAVIILIIGFVIFVLIAITIFTSRLPDVVSKKTEANEIIETSDKISNEKASKVTISTGQCVLKYSLTSAG